MKIKKTIYFSTFILFVMNILCKIIAFFRDIMLSYFYGASKISDSYLIAISIPTVIFTGVVSALLTSYIPVANKINNKDKINEFNNNLITSFTLFGLICSILLYFQSNNIVHFFGAGLKEESYLLAVHFTEIIIWCIPYLTIGYLFVAILQYKEEYLYVGMNGMILNLIMLFGIIISILNIDILPFSTLFGYILQCLIYGVVLCYKGYKYKVYLNLHDKNLLYILKVMFPIFVGQIVSELNNVVDKNLASRLCEGTITSLDYSHKVIVACHSFVIIPLSTILFTKIAKKISTNIQNVRESVLKTTSIAFCILLPINILIYVYANNIISLLFFRGAFNYNSLVITSECLKMYSLGMLPFSLRTILEKVFYADADSKTPMLNSAIGVLSNMGLSLLLVTKFKHLGLTLASSISMWFIFALFTYKLKVNYKLFTKKYILVILFSCLDFFVLIGVYFIVNSLFYMLEIIKIIITILLFMIIQIIWYYLYNKMTIKLNL